MAQSVDHYINAYPENVEEILREIRFRVKTIAPEATEGIAYGMPAYKMRGKPFFYFAAFKEHLGIYALPSTHQHFYNRLTAYKQGKGSVQFPLDKKIPYDLITEMIEFRYAMLI